MSNHPESGAPSRVASQAKTIEQLLAEKRAAENAKRRALTLSQKIAQQDYSALEHSYLRKGESLAFPEQLLPHQLQAVLMTVRNYRTNTHTLNASDVGMGKTREAACFVATVGMKRVLWLTFKNLIPQAVAELGSLDPDRIVAVPINDQSELYVGQLHEALSRPNSPRGTLPDTPPYAGGKTVIYVTNYETIHRDHWLFKPSPGHNLPLTPQTHATTTVDHPTPSQDAIHRTSYRLGKDFPVAYAHPDGFAHPKGPEWDCIIIDEATKLRNGASYNPPQFFTKTKALLHLCHPQTYRLFLTATPAENKPEEIWSYMNLFRPGQFHDLASFKRIFETYNPKTGERVVDVERLLSMLGSMVIRHSVKNLNLDLPSLDDPKWFNICTHSLTIDPESHVGQAYLSMQREALAELDQYTTLNPKVMLEVMLRLRQLLSAGPIFTFTKTFKRISPVPDAQGFPVVVKDKQSFTVKMDPPYTKHDAVEELIATLQGDGEQVIVMSCFNQPLINLHRALTGTGVYTCGIISGDTPQAERTRLIREFQQARLDVLLVNKKAAAHGLNLQKCDNWPGGASHIIHMDRWWNGMIERQANGRIVRMNTTKPCTAHYFEVQNSMDTAMRDLVQAKLDNIDSMDAELMRDTIRRSTLG